MATTTVSGSGKRNDGGTILHAGNIASSRWDNLTLAVNTDRFHYGSKLPDSGNSRLGTHAIYSGGNYATPQVAGNYIGFFINNRTLAGVAKDFLKNPSAGNFHQPIPKKETARRLDEDSWDYVTGTVTKGGNEGVSYDMLNPIGGGSSADSAANPTNAVPGELVYMVTGKIPTQDDYEARYST